MSPGIGGEDPYRRRGAFGAQNDYAGGSVAGAEQTLQRLLPFLMGAQGASLTARPSGVDWGNALAAQPPVATAPTPIGGPNVAPGSPGAEAAVQPTIEQSAGFSEPVATTTPQTFGFESPVPTAGAVTGAQVASNGATLGGLGGLLVKNQAGLRPGAGRRF
jgi:hypothetical protein